MSRTRSIGADRKRDEINAEVGTRAESTWRRMTSTLRGPQAEP
jgi:hypothetical protein